jgi:hypothetical protein
MLANPLKFYTKSALMILFQLKKRSWSNHHTFCSLIRKRDKADILVRNRQKFDSHVTVCCNRDRNSS